MNREMFEALLVRQEGETLDFKLKPHDLKSGRLDLIKDIVAMANTPREGPAYIVYGVRWTPESGSTVVGFADQIDDVDVQKAFGRDKVQPMPRFSYIALEYEGVQVGVIEIPADTAVGPSTPLKDFDGLQAGAIYFRRGSENDRALGPDLRRIVSWFLNEGVPVTDESGWTKSWANFIQEVGGFESSSNYLLAIDKIPNDMPVSLAALGLVPWRAVFDFDHESERCGLLASIKGVLAQKRVIHKIVRGEHKIQPSPGIHWFFATGLEGRNETLCSGEHKEWVKQYKRELGVQLELLVKEVSPAPVVAILMWNDVRRRGHLRTLIEELYGAFSESIKIIVVSPDGKSFAPTVEEAGASFSELNLRSLMGGIAVHFADRSPVITQRSVLPSPSGAPYELSNDDFLWLSEDLDIAHRSVGLAEDDDLDIEDFRRGGNPTWRAMHLRLDCDRDLTNAVRRQIEEDLKRRDAVRVNLYHAPGAGGSTIGMRVAWELHGVVPTAVLKRNSPKATAERISKLAALTDSVVLIVVDSGKHSESETDELFDYLRAGHVPVVLLQILRRFQLQKEAKRTSWLAAQLHDGEADRFKNAYIQAVPSKKAALSKLAMHAGENRNPFFFGLTAFEDEFKGIKSHVEARLAGLNDMQREILGFLAISHYYGQQALPVHGFAGIFGLPQSRELKLDQVFQGESRKALELLAQSTPAEVRTTHPLVALELLRQLLVEGHAIDERNSIWKQGLSRWAKKFAEFCRGVGSVPSGQLLELAKRIFVYRDNVEVLGTERSNSGSFAQLVDDIPSSQGRIEVLRHLTECFPGEAHFHAHLARIRGLTGDFKTAKDDIDHAISMQPRDALLHHMRGMILRREIAATAIAIGVDVDGLIALADDASSSFSAAREIAPDSEHGYISEIQMLLDFVDRAPLLEKLVNAKINKIQNFVYTSIERIEDLCDQAKDLYVGEDPSRLLSICRARLEGIHGDFNDALQKWDSILLRSDVAKSSIRRQIVWAILGKHGSKWEDLSDRQVRRVRTLLEQNLEEAGQDSTSLRLWLRAVRYGNTPSLDSVIEKVTYWKLNTGTLDSAYYLYVLQSLQALGGSTLLAAGAEKSLEDVRALSRFRRDRAKSFEWVGVGDGMSGLIHQSRLGSWVGEFWEETNVLRLIKGRVAAIDGPHKGLLELPGGLKAFFVPGKAGISEGRDENAPVNCVLGFSYDGLRAWKVERIDQEDK